LVGYLVSYKENFLTHTSAIYCPQKLAWQSHWYRWY